jgi:drug/metabolite transporter (DMT)-like permease
MVSRRRESLGLLLGFIGMVCFAGTLPATRVAIPYLDAWFLTFGRAAFAGLLAVAMLVVARRRVPPRRYWAELTIAAVLLIYGFPLFTALAMMSVPVAHGGVVLGVLPLVTTLAATLVAGERPSLGFWLAGAAGGAIVVGFALRHGAGSLALGDLWLLGAILSAAFGYTYAGKLSGIMPGWEVNAWQLALSLPVALPAMLWLWPADAAAVPWPAWTALGYVAVMVQLVGFFFWNAGLAMGGIARVGQLQLLQPFAILLMAARVNGEPLTAETLGFAAAVVATVMVGRRMRIARSPVSSPSPARSAAPESRAVRNRPGHAP